MVTGFFVADLSRPEIASELELITGIPMSYNCFLYDLAISIPPGSVGSNSKEVPLLSRADFTIAI